MVQAEATGWGWRRYALIAELAKRLEDKSPQFGKTALQKLVCILQDVFGIDCGYDFELYTYGPFTSQLLQDLDLVEHMGGVSIRPVLSAIGNKRNDIELSQPYLFHSRHYLFFRTGIDRIQKLHLQVRKSKCMRLL